MSTRARGAVLLAVLLLAVVLPAPSSLAQTSSRLVRLLPRQAPVFLDTGEPAAGTSIETGAAGAAEGGGLVRLVLPATVLSACRPDLSDLRLFDRARREVPFLIDRGPAPATRRETERRFRPEILETLRSTVDREDRPPLYRERYLLSAPADASSEETSWELVIETRARTFVRRLEVRVLRRKGDLELENRNALFRLEAPRRERTRFPLPAWRPAPGDRLEVVIEGEEDGYLSPTFVLETHRSLEEARQTRVPLEMIERHREGRRTVVELLRPRGLVPESLTLVTDASGFVRHLTVWDAGPESRASPLGRGALYRVTGVGNQLELPVAPPLGDRLRVVIDNADEPAFESFRIEAVVRRPALVFELPVAAAGGAPGDTGSPEAGAEEPIATLRFGGGRVHRPQYGLARLAPELPAAGLAAEQGLAFYDPSRLRAARLGEPSDNPDFDGRPALAFAMHPGAALDSRPYRLQRALEPRPSPEGLYRLPLALEDLAAARPDLADLRLVDAESRQWAYLLDRDGEPTLRPLTVEGPEPGEDGSRYRLRLPSAPATVERLVLDSPQPFFDRAFRLYGFAEEGDSNPRLLVEDRLVRRADDPRPIEIGFAPVRLHHLELVVTDGDDAPLDWSRAEARFASAAVYFVADPDERYRLLLGQPDAEPPRYELDRVREVVLAVESRTVETGALEDNPDFRRGARLSSREGLQKVLLWGVLGLAVVLLAGLTLRLARQED